MKIIIFDDKEFYENGHISELESKGTVVFHSKVEDWDLIEDMYSDEEKVVLLSPAYCNWNLPNDVVSKFKNVKGISIPTTRYGWLDVKFLREKGIVVTNVPKYSTESVAELAIFLMFSITRKIPLVINSGWKLDYDSHLGFDIKGKSMGIIGLGDIGSRIAELGVGLGMEVSYWSRGSRDDRFNFVELRDLVKNSDYLFLSIADFDDTEKFFDKELIDLMKKGSFIINTTGNSIWDYDYLVDALRRGDISGIAVDESVGIVDTGLNIMSTPHIGWYTEESVEEDYRILVESALSIVDGCFINVVN